MKRVALTLVTLAITLLPAPSLAQSATPTFNLTRREGSVREQPPWAWTVHGILTGASLLEAGIIALTDPPTNSVLLTQGIDPWARSKYSEGAAGASKAFGMLQLAAPVPAIGTLTSGRHFAQGVFIYGEALSISVGLSRLVDHLVARPRPYTYNPSSPSSTPRCLWLERADCRSFYSGRASAAYAAAFAGGYLFQEFMSDRYVPKNGYASARQRDNARKERDQIIGAAWAMQFALAGATAHLQARAGEVFYSDVLVGLLAGSAIGIGTYASYGGELSLSKWSVGGMLGGTLIGWIPPIWVAPTASEYSVGLLPFDAPGVGFRVVGKL